MFLSPLVAIHTRKRQSDERSLPLATHQWSLIRSPSLRWRLISTAFLPSCPAMGLDSRWPAARRTLIRRRTAAFCWNCPVGPFRRPLHSTMLPSCMATISSPLRPKWQDVPQDAFRQIYREIYTHHDLAALWEVRPRQITYYALKANKDRLYTSFEAPRRRGTPRKIEVPSPTLRYLQRLIHESFTRIYGPHPAVHGFRTGRSIVTNAENHLNRKYVLTLDLLDFFPSITRPRIFGRLTTSPYDFQPRIANVIASLATNSLDTLPQGSPCSPIISNMIVAELDAELARFAASKHCHYTRYADDITISTKRQHLSPEIAKYPNSRGTGQAILGDGLMSIIERHGFRVNHRKTRLQSDWTRQVCTGLIVNGQTVAVPRAYVRRLRSLIHHWTKYGWEDAASVLAVEKGRPTFKERGQLVNHVQGRLDYLRMVRGQDDVVYQRMCDRFQAIPENH